MRFFYDTFELPSDPGGDGGGGGGPGGQGGGGSGSLAPELTPAVVIGLNLLRDDLAKQPEVLTEAPTIEALSKDRRKRAAYNETKRTAAPRASGINL